jgi:hypothetical protein
MSTQQTLARLLLALTLAGCAKAESAAPSEQAAAESQPTQPAGATGAEKAELASSGIYIKGTTDLDGCAILTSADLAPLFGAVKREVATAIGGMTLCRFERDDGRSLSVTVHTTAELSKKGVKSTAEYYDNMAKPMLRQGAEEVPAGDGALIIPGASMMLVRKGDVLLEFAVITSGDDSARLTAEQGRKLAPVIAAKLAALPADAGLPKEAVRPTASATHTNVDVCGLVSDAEASAIFGGKARGTKVAGRSTEHETDGCIYQGDNGSQLLTVIAYTSTSLTQMKMKTPDDYFQQLTQGPLAGATEKVEGIGDGAVHTRMGFVVKSKDVVLHITSNEPKEKLTAYAKKALERL